MFGLGKLFYVIILLVNAIAVLNEKRFLNRLGLSTQQQAFGQESSASSRLLNVVSSVQTVMRVPLIVVNVVVILYELILG